MSAALRIELRHLKRSAPLWIGVVLALVITERSMRGLWPTVEAGAALGYHSVLVLSAFVFMSGAWLGLRDRLTGVAPLVESAPTPDGTVTMLRLGGIAILGALAFIVVLLAGVGLAASRGGRGTPQITLVVDGVLGTTLAGWLGFAVGRVTGSRALSLLLAPAYALLLFWLELWVVVDRFRPSLEWLSPAPRLPEFSARLGYLPDIFGIHLLYLLAVLLAVVGGLLMATSRGRQDPHWWPYAGVTTAAVLFAIVLAAALLGRPDSYQPRSADPATWLPLFDSSAGLESSSGAAVNFPDDGAASACSRGAALRVCVYPAYGTRYARAVLTALQPEARLLRDFPGVASSVRMVPATGGACRGSDGEVILSETADEAQIAPGELQGYLAYCSMVNWDSRNSPTSRAHMLTPAQATVELWVLLATKAVGQGELRAALARPPAPPCPAGETCAPGFDAILQHGPLAWTRDEVTAAFTLSKLPPTVVRARLLLAWSDVRDGRVSLTALLHRLTG